MKPVKLSKPTMIWVNNFQYMKEKLQSLLGEMAIDIEHIGSTAIPGLPAKDIIDIQVGIKDFMLYGCCKTTIERHRILPDRTY